MGVEGSMDIRNEINKAYNEFNKQVYDIKAVLCTSYSKSLCKHDEIKDAAYLASEISEFIRNTGKVPSIGIFTDIIVHGININNYIDSIDKALAEREIPLNLWNTDLVHIHAYMACKDSLVLSDKTQSNVVAIHSVDRSTLRHWLLSLTDTNFNGTDIDEQIILCIYNKAVMREQYIQSEILGKQLRNWDSYSLSDFDIKLKNIITRHMKDEHKNLIISTLVVLAYFGYLKVEVHTSKGGESEYILKITELSLALLPTLADKYYKAVIHAIEKGDNRVFEEEAHKIGAESAWDKRAYRFAKYLMDEVCKYDYKIEIAGIKDWISG